MALSALATAASDLRYTFAAFVSRAPITCPDIWFVLAKHISSAVSALLTVALSASQDVPCAPLSPPVNYGLKLDIYSPTQAMATNAPEAYSAYSQSVSVEVSDATSDGVRVILNQMRKERIVLMVCIFALVSLLAAHASSAIDAAISSRRSSASHAATKSDTSQSLSVTPAASFAAFRIPHALSVSHGCVDGSSVQNFKVAHYRKFWTLR